MGKITSFYRRGIPNKANNFGQLTQVNYTLSQKMYPIYDVPKSVPKPKPIPKI